MREIVTRRTVKDLSDSLDIGETVAFDMDPQQLEVSLLGRHCVLVGRVVDLTPREVWICLEMNSRGISGPTFRVDRDGQAAKLRLFSRCIMGYKELTPAQYAEVEAYRERTKHATTETG